MKTLVMRLAAVAISLAATFGALTAAAQNSLPAPGTGQVGGGFGPGPGWGGSGPGFGPNWGGAWGSPWGPGYNYGPAWAPSLGNPNLNNSGTGIVNACGYDANGIWRVIPLNIAYTYNGFYNVTVINAWNPWTQSWNRDIMQPAYQTTYLLNGTTFHWYAPLSTGTYYFNL